MFLEYIYRSGFFKGFWTSLYILIIPIMIGQWALFHSFRTAPSIFLAGAMFTVINALLRLTNGYILKEIPGTLGYAGIALMVVAVVLLKLDV